MKELFAIVAQGKRSLLRGFVIVFLLVLPFTFLPAIVRRGFSLEVISQHFPAALLYALLLAAGIISILLLSNYEKFLQKKRLYELPAFTALDFNQAVEGYNAIIREVSTYLIGKVGGYFFRVHIIDPKKELLQVEISPLIHVGQNLDLFNQLTHELGLQENLYLSRILSLTEEQLQHSDAILKEIVLLAEQLTNLGVPPLAVTKGIIHPN